MNNLSLFDEVPSELGLNGVYMKETIVIIMLEMKFSWKPERQVQKWRNTTAVASGV